MSRLTPAQLDALGASLAIRESELARLVHHDALEQRDPASGDLPDPAEQSADRVLAGEFREFAGTVAEHHATELRALREAQARMRAGEYGLCLVCGDPIGFERLLVQPAASRCLGCQSAFEEHARSHGA